MENLLEKLIHISAVLDSIVETAESYKATSEHRKIDRISIFNHCTAVQSIATYAKAELEECIGIVDDCPDVDLL